MSIYGESDQVPAEDAGDGETHLVLHYLAEERYRRRDVMLHQDAVQSTRLKLIIVRHPLHKHMHEHGGVGEKYVLSHSKIALGARIDAVDVVEFLVGGNMLNMRIRPENNTTCHVHR